MARWLPCVAGALLLIEAAAADDYRQGGQGRLHFDIPSQTLTEALESYSVVTGRQVVYNGRLASGRSSMMIRGLLTPEQALEGLLQGTGLSPHYVAADAFLLEPNPLGEGSPVNTAPPGAVARYYGQLQLGLKRAFCADRRLQPGSYRVAVSFWIGPSGAVSRADLLSTTGDAVRDDAISQAVYGLAVGAPPPAGFAQPVVLVIEPQAAARDCAPDRATDPPRGLR
ncbi:hypothetical protein [Bradyrhizobium sp. 2TAF24]|uniref:hypothetical protein n=1 Tax=Bradyrhizobium sp. 2TAF24 TaxID=3233011 RepID=UPI003F9203FF